MDNKLYTSDLRVMELLWENGVMTAKDIATRLKLSNNYSKTTVYTLIKKCIDKGAIERTEPDYLCRPLITKKQVQELELTELVNKLFDGSKDMLISSLFDNQISYDKVEKLRKMVEEWSD